MTDAIVIAIYAVFGSVSIVITTALTMQKNEKALTRLYTCLGICTPIASPGTSGSSFTMSTAICSCSFALSIPCTITKKSPVAISLHPS